MLIQYGCQTVTRKSLEPVTSSMSAFSSFAFSRIAPCQWMFTSYSPVHTHILIRYLLSLPLPDDICHFRFSTCDRTSLIQRNNLHLSSLFQRNCCLEHNTIFWRPIPFPTIIATGVASPSAHGQLITSTAIPLDNAKPILCPAISHTIIVITAIVITVGTNTPEYTVRNLCDRCFCCSRITYHLDDL